MTVKKNGVIEGLKKKLMELLKRDEDTKINMSNIVLAEVRSHAHVKILVSYAGISVKDAEKCVFHKGVVPWVLFSMKISLN